MRASRTKWVIVAALTLAVIEACLSAPGEINSAYVESNGATSPLAAGGAAPTSPQNTNSVVYLPSGQPLGDEPVGVATGMPSTGTTLPATGTAQQNNTTTSPNVAATPNTATTPNTASSPNTATSPNTTSTQSPNGSMVMWPNVPFNDYSGPRGSKVVALTFDDGPDGQSTKQNNTGAVLDFLKANNLTATFFICGDVWTLVTQDALAQATIKRIPAEGHELGTHTFTHPHLDTVTQTALAEQFTDNLAMARSVLGSGFSFSMYRAPFGFPFQTNNPNVPWVAPIVAPNGVHVGWGIDTDDWKCAQNGQNGQCILNNLETQLKAGRSGPILMHAVYQLTVQTLPAIVQMLKTYGYTIVTAGQMIQDRYGMSSADVQKLQAKGNYSTSQVGAAAVTECGKNHTISVPY